MSFGSFKNVTSKLFTYKYIHLYSLTLGNIRYVSKVKWSIPGKEITLSLTPQCSSFWKGSLMVTLDYGCQVYFILPEFSTLTPGVGVSEELE